MAKRPTKPRNGPADDGDGTANGTAAADDAAGGSMGGDAISVDIAGGYSMAVTAVANEADRRRVEDGLVAFNATASPYFTDQPENEGQALDVFVRDAAGTILGAVTAHTTWDWLSIELVWLDERLRGRGYGERLMRAVEDEARRRGCAHARVTTYSFQAPGFYERLGYCVVGRLDGFPPGGAYYWLRKDLAP